MNQAHSAYPAIRHLGAFGATGIEDASAWSTRSATSKYAATRAKNEAMSRGNMAAMGAFQQSESLAAQASALVSANKADFSVETEMQVAKHLENARSAFHGGIGLASTTPPQYLPSISFPTWTISAAKLPPGAPGAISPGVIPPPDKKAPPKGDEGGVDEGSTTTPVWYQNPTVLAIGGVGAAVAILAIVMAVRR